MTSQLSALIQFKIITVVLQYSHDSDNTHIISSDRRFVGTCGEWYNSGYRQVPRPTIITIR